MVIVKKKKFSLLNNTGIGIDGIPVHYPPQNGGLNQLQRSIWLVGPNHGQGSSLFYVVSAGASPLRAGYLLPRWHVGKCVLDGPSAHVPLRVTSLTVWGL